MTAELSLHHHWLSQDVTYMRAKRLSTTEHRKYLLRRKWQVCNNISTGVARGAGTQGCWYSGVVVPRGGGTQGWWYSGVLVLGVVVLRSGGTQVWWYPGVVVPRDGGTQWWWSPGVVVLGVVVPRCGGT